MFHAWQDLAFRSLIASELVGNDHARKVLELFQKLSEKSFGGLFVTSALHQDIKYGAMLIHRSPEVMLLATNRQNHLVYMPFISTERTAAAQLVGIGLPEFQAPLTHRFIGRHDPALCVVRSSTSRKLSEKRKYNHTAWLIISGGKR